MKTNIIEASRRFVRDVVEYFIKPSADLNGEWESTDIKVTDNRDGTLTAIHTLRRKDSK